jgi:uncharacterized repeat protein (TIGR03803 family)
LHSFSGSDGSYPSSPLIQATNEDFFGTTDTGSNGGTVFRMDAAGNVTTLHTFSGPDGDHPQTLIQAHDGYFYGTTLSGGAGANGGGTVFSMNASGSLTVLHSFMGEALYPAAPLIQASDGYLYGTTTSSMKCTDCGTVFRMDMEGNVTVLHTFSGSDGFSPVAPLIQASDGNLYGTAYSGGVNDSGVIFRISNLNSLLTTPAQADAASLASR